MEGKRECIKGNYLPNVCIKSWLVNNVNNAEGREKGHRQEVIKEVDDEKGIQYKGFDPTPSECITGRIEK